MDQNSKKSIMDKLKWNNYLRKLILNKPTDVTDFATLDYDTKINKGQYDLIFIFIFTLKDFKQYVRMVTDKKLLSSKGCLYFAYPKKNSPKYEKFMDCDRFFSTGFTSEDVYVQGSDIEFVRIVSLNNIFTVVGLKVRAKKTIDPLNIKKSRGSDENVERVDNLHNTEDVDNLNDVEDGDNNEDFDNMDNVEDVVSAKKYLEYKKELDFYNSLSLGRQKYWARYVRSAKRQGRQDKGLAKMKSILIERYKSIDLYRGKWK